MSVGIIVATEYELKKTKLLMQNETEHRYHDLMFYSGQINDNDVIIVKCGIGKVNSARTTQVLIDKFKIDYIVNLGAAGAVNPELNVQDVVIGSQLVQYDFDVTALDDVEKGEIEGVGKFISSDEKLIEKCKSILEKICNNSFKTVIGKIGSADFFCADSKVAMNIRNEFNVECVEMEGAAIAHVCFLDKIPFVIIRGISDTPNGNNKIDYYSYCEKAAEYAVAFLKELI